MNEDEYLFRRPIIRQVRTTTDQPPLSGQSSMGSDEARLGDMDEFDQMIQRYQEKHQQA